MSAVVLAFSTTVFIRLWTFGECPILEIRESCAVRAFPIFGDGYGAGGGDSGCRSCACNTLFYIDKSCGVNGANNTEFNGDGEGCQSHGSGPRPASQMLNSSAIMGPTASLLMSGCPSDIRLLETIAYHANQLAVMDIGFPSPSALDRQVALT